MENYPCTCGGENPSCFRCDGTGLVASHALPLRSDGRVRPLPKNEEILPPPTVTKPKAAEIKSQAEKAYLCPKCKEWFFDASDFIRHARTFHPKPKVKQNKPAKPKQNDLRQVERTPNEQPKNNLQTLEQMKETQRLLDDARSSLKKLRRSFPQAHLCENCLVLFKTVGELKSHQKSTHEITPSRATIAPKKKKKVRGSAAKQSETTDQKQRKTEKFPFVQSMGYTKEQRAMEHRMDATFGMGGFARDHGQFGSSPSYDGMDDESSP